MSRSLKAAAFLAAAAASPAAQAKIVEAPGLPATPGFNLFSESGALDTATKLTAPPAVALKAGGAALVFEMTSLVEIADTLGGDIQHAGDASDSTYWLCYSQPGSATTAAAIVWFQSGEMGGDEHTLGAIAVETAPATLPAECVEPKKPLDLETGLPGLAAKRGDLDAAFAPSDPKDELLVFSHEGQVTEGPAKGANVLTLVGYRLEGDLVSAYQLAQVTVH